MDDHLVNLHEKKASLKRGGGVRFPPLDLVLAERDLAVAPEVAQTAYEREWALGLMERALARLRQEHENGGRKGRTEMILRFFSLDEAPSCAQAADGCGMTVAQFKAALHRARQRFREILREEVAETVEDEAQVEDEVADLIRAFSS